jgi:hypothetical protein
MPRFELRYRPAALADLEDIFRGVPRVSASPVTDATSSIRERCRRITLLPHGGRPLDLRRICVVLALCGLVWASPLSAEEDDGYSTATRAEYVFACMAANGGTQEALRQCSCGIDVISSVLPYDKYERAETVLRMRRSAGGYLAQEFRSAPTNAIVRDLEEAEAEAEVRCF